MKNTEIYLFVYGSLMKQAGNLMMDKYGTFIGYGEIKGSLYHLGAYPGVKLTRKNIVKGEIWKIAKVFIKTFDRYEGYPLLYNREKTKAKLTDTNKIIDVMLYTYNYEPAEEQFIIKNGDWMSVEQIYSLGTYIK